MKYIKNNHGESWLITRLSGDGYGDSQGDEGISPLDTHSHSIEKEIEWEVRKIIPGVVSSDRQERPPSAAPAERPFSRLPLDLCVDVVCILEGRF